MKTIVIKMMLVAGLWAAAPAVVSAAETNTPAAQLQRGLFEEEANHDLPAAIRSYQAVIAQYDQDRKVAATAVFRLGECYRQQGRTAEANVQYERVLKEFADQDKLAELSRKYLPEHASIRRQSPAVVTASTTEADILLEDDAVQLEGSWASAESGPDKHGRRYFFSSVTLGKATATATFRPKISKEGAYHVDVWHAQGRNRSEKAQWTVASLDGQVVVEVNQQTNGGRWVRLVTGKTFAAGTGGYVRLSNQGDGAAGTIVVADAVRFLPAGDEEATTNAGVIRAESGSLEGQEILRLEALRRDSPDLVNDHKRIYTAIQLNQLKVVAWLLENQVDINSPGHTPLMEAVLRGNRPIVEMLLAHGADVRVAGSAGATALHYAATGGSKGLVELLLAKGAEINAVCRPPGNEVVAGTALHNAAAKGFLAVVETLLAKGADINIQETTGGSTALRKAIESGSVPVVDLLLQKGADVNLADKDGYTPLIMTVRIQHLPLMKRLLAAGADVNAAVTEQGQARGTTALTYAIENQQEEMVALLLERGAKVDLQVNRSASPEMIRGRSSLMEWGTPLHMAAGRKNVEILRLLLKAGAKTEVRLAGTRLSPLGTVILTTKSVQALQLLLEFKADPNAPAYADNTPLAVAIDARAPDLVNVLLEQGADPNRKNYDGRTPLFLAVSSGQEEIVRLLLEHKADPNMAGPDGALPIYQTPSETLKKLLIEHGASIHAFRLGQIAVTRDGTNLTAVFKKGEGFPNRYSLLELVARYYGQMDGAQRRPFPDLARVTIERLDAATGQTNRIPVNLEKVLQTGDCSGDVWLEWGDIVTIPETDHLVGETWSGFSGEIRDVFEKCLGREISIVIKGEITRKRLRPILSTQAFRRNPATFKPEDVPIRTSRLLVPVGAVFSDGTLVPEPSTDWLMLSCVLRESGLLRTSSDTAHVKVKHFDPVTKEATNLVYDLSRLGAGSDLRLRDGDVIEVPEK